MLRQVTIQNPIEFNSSLTSVTVISPTTFVGDLLRLDRNFVIGELAKQGVILFRGYDSSMDSFAKFASFISPKTGIDPAREFFASNVQIVTSGFDEIGLHCENGTTPLCPTLVWFYCEVAANSGSQTTVCDGELVWKSLSNEAQNLLSSKRIKFIRDVPEKLWTSYVRHHFPEISEDIKISQEILNGIFNRIDGAKLNINSDGSLNLSHTTFAAKSSFFSSKIAFANSIFTPSYNYEMPTITFEDDTSIPEWLLAECRQKTALHTIEINWQSGDIVLIDNTRVMHGRRKIIDPKRRLFTSLGFLSSDDLNVCRNQSEKMKVGQC